MPAMTAILSSNDPESRADQDVTRHQRLQVALRGGVQGVGMRPFVYRLATELQLAGWVRNDPQGAVLEIEGPLPALHQFLTRLQTELPPRATLHSVTVHTLAAVGATAFVIQPSTTHGSTTALVLPDLSPCAACLHDLFDSRNRRAGYAFTNCTQCGPRFSIVEALPYDRSRTTMRLFPLCPACQAEYNDMSDRRFHAQPNACPACGPTLRLLSPDGQCLAIGAASLNRAAAALRCGHIVAVQGVGGFHLLADARNAATIARLRARKARPDKALALMVGTLEDVRALCVLPSAVEPYLTAPETPIVLLRRQPAVPIADNVAPDNPTLGVMLPSTPLHHMLMRALGFPVVATSGNLHDEPICTDENDALQRLGDVADVFLVHNRPIARHVDDSVAWFVLDELRLLRRARGHAPLPIRLPRPLPTILAVGSHLKNTIALSLGQHVFLSQHIGNLDTPQALVAFAQVIADFLRLYEAVPVAIAHDMHPDYRSTQWAQQYATQRALPLIPVQHHHAHFAACLAEHGETAPTLGLTWDGTGYGPDGTLWGGEFLFGTAAAVTRLAHLHPFRLPGGAAAVREPRRVALALLWEIYGEAGLAQHDLAPVKACSPTERRLFVQILARGIHTPVTTSAGRLFDGIAALLGGPQRVSFEGQAAMYLEFLADPQITEAYPLAMTPAPQGTGPFVVDWRPMVLEMLHDIRHAVTPCRIAARFHNTMVEIAAAVVQTVEASRVALTGGCFQNRWLIERITHRLRSLGCTVLLHRQVPPNDGGISLGQVAVAAAQLVGEGASPREETSCALAYRGK